MPTFQPHDRATLLGGKLHALLQRPYTKGRDLYDLIWYLGDPGWPAPNLTLLDAALRQTGWEGDTIHADNWRTTILGRLDALAWDRVAADVRPFLERAEDVVWVTRENAARLLGHPRAAGPS
ncbi:MAG: nucleotidyl transferase AbiEii/AbiGii toxin family protein [Deltaproteobacteria bacterium]|nr:nucleotidyl transferase AbiEii/AbiGii toxin family protein [Deltaproteobacteria bacterium]